jgi:hypothetical protein
MNNYKCFFIIWMIILPGFVLAQANLKIENKRVVIGETLNYKATWGFLTIGSGTTRIDTNIYQIGSNNCYKIDVTGQTNGIAKIFYVRDKWISYIDTATITTHQAFRSIREGRHALDEQVRFDHPNKKAEVKVYDKETKSYVLKKVYDTPDNIRDVVAGFMAFRLVDLSKCEVGEVFTVNGFNEDESYRIDVTYFGKEYIKTDNGTILCHKVKPSIPNNKRFDGKDAIVVWLSADEAQIVVRIRAKMFVGNIYIELMK